MIGALPGRLLVIGILAWGVTAVAPARAQYPNPGPASQPETPAPGTSADRPRFAVDATVEPGGGVPVVRFDYRLARAELLFERRAGSYHAAYEVRVVLYRDKGKRQIAGDVFVREIDVPTYAETRPLGNDVIDHVELSAPPDKYDAQVVIHDLVAERSSGTVIDVDVPKQAAGPIWFSDLTFGALKRTGPGVVDPRSGVVLNPSRRYSGDIANLAVYFEIVDTRPSGPSDAYAIATSIWNDQQKSVFQRDTTLTRQAGRTPFLLQPGISSLPAGSYRLEVDLKSPLLPEAPGKKALAIRREKTFDVAPSAASIASDPRNTFEVLDYIAADSERVEMKKLATDAQRQEFWNRFWKLRDPTPDTPENEAMSEFYRRVQYANQHFLQGWKSDMGRIYIKYGQPDEVVRNPFNFDRPPEEIWYYYQNHWTFTFVDKGGFGSYMLDETRSYHPSNS
ncbi:MAG: GWxTD domain-containing protein [Bacteroidota bacterium]